MLVVIKLDALAMEVVFNALVGVWWVYGEKSMDHGSSKPVTTGYCWLLWIWINMIYSKQHFLAIEVCTTQQSKLMMNSHKTTQQSNKAPLQLSLYSLPQP